MKKREMRADMETLKKENACNDLENDGNLDSCTAANIALHQRRHDDTPSRWRWEPLLPNETFVLEAQEWAGCMVRIRTMEKQIKKLQWQLGSVTNEGQSK